MLKARNNALAMLIVAAWLTVGMAQAVTNLVTFSLADFTGQPSTNRAVQIVPMSADILDDLKVFHSDSNGEFAVTNMDAGLYQVNVQAPPRLSTRYIAVPETNGVFTAVSLLTTSTNLAWPPPGYAWSIAASDARYSPVGAGGLAFVPQFGSLNLSNWSQIATGALSSAGASLTNLNGASIQEHTINSNQINATLDAIYRAGGNTNAGIGHALLAADQVFTGSNVFAKPIRGSGALLTNLNGAAIQAGTLNTWQLGEPSFVGGSNTFEPVYSKTAGTNIWVIGVTNHAADGLYTLRTNWTDTDEYAIYTNANRDVIWMWSDGEDTFYTFTNNAGATNFGTSAAAPNYPGGNLALTGGLCGLAYFNWSTNYAFEGFGVNGQTPTDGAVLAFGQGLDYTTNGGVWTIYATNLTEACLSSNVWWAATNRPPGGSTTLDGAALTNLNATELRSGTVALGRLASMFGGAETNLLHLSDRNVVFSTNYLRLGAIGTNSVAGAGTNVLQIFLTNGFAGWSGQNIGGTYAIYWSTDYTHWRKGFTNVPVALAMVRELSCLGCEVGDPDGLTNLVVWTWSRPEFYGRTNPLAMQHVQVSSPRWDDDVTPRRWSLSKMAERSHATNLLWSTQRAVRRVDAEGYGLNLDSQFEVIVDKSHSNYFAVNLMDVGSPFWSARSTNQPARIASLTAGVLTHVYYETPDLWVWEWHGTSPVTVYVETNGLAGTPTVEWAESAWDPEWQLVTGTTNSYPLTTNGCYVISFDPPAGALAFRASVKGGKALEVFGDVKAQRLFGNGAGLTNLNGSNITTHLDLGTMHSIRASDAFLAGVLYATNGVNIPPLNSGINPSGMHYGDGSLLSNLNATELRSGTVPVERLPSIPVSSITAPGAVLTNGASFPVTMSNNTMFVVSSTLLITNTTQYGKALRVAGYGMPSYVDFGYGNSGTYGITAGTVGFEIIDSAFNKIQYLKSGITITPHATGSNVLTVAGSAIVTDTLTVTNGTAYPQLPQIPTNSVPASTAAVTNYILCNLSNTVAGSSGGMHFIATNTAAAGSFLIQKMTVTSTVWP